MDSSGTSVALWSQVSSKFYREIFKEIVPFIGLDWYFMGLRFDAIIYGL